MSPLRASSLASTLMVVSLLLVLGFALSGLGFAHLNLSRGESNRQAAQNLAESALALTTEQLMAHLSNPGEGVNTSFGSNNEVITARLYGDSDSAPDLGRVSFDRSQSDYPFSTNNLAGKDGKFGYNGALVPPSCIHLVATGVYHKVTRRVEAVLRIPTFPYAITSSGSFQCGDGLRVCSLPPGSVPVVSRDALPGTDQQRPGDMLCNGDVTMGSSCSVTGVLHYLGTLKAAGAALGCTERLAVAAPILGIDLDSYDPGLNPGLTGDVVASRYDEPFDGLVNGTLRYQPSSGRLHLDGDLEFEDPHSLLFVKGDLDVAGAIKGKGVLVATGKVSVGQGVELEGSHEVALLAGGDVRLSGSNPDPQSLGSFFQGLVYTKGSFQADNIAVVGALVTNGGPQGSVRLSNVQMFSDPDYVFNTALEVSGTVICCNDGGMTGTRLGQVTAGDNSESWGNEKPSVSNSNRWPAASVTYQGRLDPAQVAQLYNRGKLDLSGHNPNFNNFNNQAVDMMTWSLSVQPLSRTLDASGNPLPAGDPLVFTSVDDAANAFQQLVGNKPVTVGVPPNTHVVPAGVLAARHLRQMLQGVTSAGRAKDVLPAKGPPAVQSHPLQIDTRQFLNPQDRLKIVLWRPLE